MRHRERQFDARKVQRYMMMMACKIQKIYKCEIESTCPSFSSSSIPRQEFQKDLGRWVLLSSFSNQLRYHGNKKLQPVKASMYI